MTSRRDFLKRLTLTAAGLYVADDAISLLTEPRRKYWSGHDFGYSPWKFSVGSPIIVVWSPNLLSNSIGKVTYVDDHSIHFSWPM